MTDASRRIAGLTPEKLNLLVQRMRQGNPSESQQVSITRVDAGSHIPLSFSQERLWFNDRLEPGNIKYNLSGAIRVDGKLNIPAIAQALSEIVRRHETLRTIFPDVDGRPEQVVQPYSDAPLPMVDLRDLSEREQTDLTQRLSAEEGNRSFDLAVGPMIRATLLVHNPTRHVVFQTAHHIICDGWSRPLYYREIQALYQAFTAGFSSPLAELALQYADFAVWQRNFLQGEKLASLLDYWKRHIEGAPYILKMLLLRTGRIAPRRSSKQHHRFPSELAALLDGVVRAERVSLFMILLTAFDILLYRYSGQDDLIVGTAIANRNRRETESLIGLFINMLPLRVRLEGKPRLKELLLQVRDVTLGAYNHQDLPLEELVDELKLARDLRYTPLFQAVFVLHNLQDSNIELPGLTMSSVHTAPEAGHFDLCLSVSNAKGSMSASLAYNANLFEDDLIKRMLDHLEAILFAIALQPEKGALEISLSGKDDRGEISLKDSYRTDQFSF
jgi:hypothetical protein